MKQLIIVDKPECVEPARKIIGEMCDVVDYAHLCEIKDRSLVYWPTAPGLGSAQRADKFAKTAAKVKVLVTSDKPKGWNAAQAATEGWDYQAFIAWAKDRTVIVNHNHIEIHHANGGANGSTNGDDVQAPKPIFDKLTNLGLAMKGGAPIGDLANVVRLLEHDRLGDAVWYDEFYRRILHDLGKPWEEIDTLRLQQTLQNEYGFRKIGADVIYGAIEVHGRNNTRNAPRDWMNSLDWDKTNRIHSFFSTCMGADPSPYLSAVGHNFWVGMVARVFKPGCQNDHMVVLEGPQNVGKTSALRLIGGPWYVEANENIHSKDFFMVLNGRIVVEIAELDSFNRAEVNRIKQVISCPTDAYRRPYDRLGSDYPRTCVLVGTTNEDTYLRDTTGGRRFWPIRCGRINLNAIKDIRNQLFAEAVHCFRAGESWHETPIEETKEIQESRREKDEWEAILSSKLALVDWVTVSDAAMLLDITTDRLGIREQKRIAYSLRKAGFVQNVRKIQGKCERGWEKTDL